MKTKMTRTMPATAIAVTPRLVVSGTRARYMGVERVGVSEVERKRGSGNRNVKLAPYEADNFNGSTARDGGRAFRTRGRGIAGSTLNVRDFAHSARSDWGDDHGALPVEICDTT